MQAVVEMIDKEIAELEAKLAQLRQARTLLIPSSPSIVAVSGTAGCGSLNAVRATQELPPVVQGFSTVPTDRVRGQLLHPPKPVDAPQGNASGADRAKTGSAAPLTLEQCRERITAALTADSPQTPKQLQTSSGLKDWQIFNALKDWEGVEKTGKKLRDPYRLKP